MVCRQVCCLCPCNGEPQENLWFAERLAYMGCSLSKDTVWRWKASNSFLGLKSDPKAEGQCRWKGKALFVREHCKGLCNFPGSSNLSWPRQELYWDLVVVSSCGLAQLIDGGSSLVLELGARFGLLEQLIQLAARTECVAIFWYELQSGPGRHAWLSFLQQWLRRHGWAHLFYYSTLESSFPPLLMHDDYGLGPSEPHLQ